MNVLMLFRIAWRNLWRQKRRTILTLVSIAFGGFMAIMMTAMQDRSWADFIDTAARLGGGHVTVQNAEYLDRPSLTRTIKDTEQIRETAEGVRDVGLAVDRIAGEVMLSTTSDSFGATFIAYDPTHESSHTLQFLEGMQDGSWFETSKDPGIILGKKLADNLGAEIGDKVVFTLMNREGEVVAGMGRLRGIIGTGAPSMDAALALLPIDVVRKMVGYEPDEATQVAVFLDDSRASHDVASRLARLLAKADVALSWDEISPDLKGFIAMKKGGAVFFEVIIGLLVAAGIFNTLFVSVMERVREFGIQLAIGWTPRQLFGMVMLESLQLAVVGLAACAAITWWPYKYMSETGIDMSAAYGETVEVSGVGFDMTLHVGIYPESAAMIAMAILLATLTAGLYPAWKAGRVEPVDTIKLV